MAFVLIESGDPFMTWPKPDGGRKAFTVSRAAMKATKMKSGDSIAVYFDIDAAQVKVARTDAGDRKLFSYAGKGRNAHAFTAATLLTYGNNARSVRCPLVEATDDSLTFDVSEALKLDDEYA